MFFFTELLNNFILNIFKNIFNYVDYLAAKFYFDPVGSFLEKWGPLNFLSYFHTYWFKTNYIFYWNKLEKSYLVGIKSVTYESLTKTKTPILSRLVLNYKNYNLFNYEFFYKATTSYLTYIVSILKKTFGFGFHYLKGLIFILFIDACLTDDEPLWEPIEWSLVQS